MARPPSELHERVARAVPELRAAIDEHRRDHDGEVLDHVLFGDFTRFVLAAHDAGDDELVRRCLRFLEDELRHGDEATRDVVSVSFVENVCPWDPARAAFVDSWPDALRAEADRHR